LYWNGKGVPQDGKEMLKWAHKAADQNNVLALKLIGQAYENGYGGPKNYKEALSWYLKSIDQGYPCGSHKLGIDLYNFGEAYERGAKIEQNYQEAMKWYTKAAAQEDNIDAQYKVAMFYKEGKGCEKDCQKAFQWFCKIPSKIRWDELSCLGLTDTYAPQIASLLSQATSLSAINLSKNKLTFQGLKPILAVLQAQQNLIKLDVTDNLIDDAGGKELVVFFEKHPSLKKLIICSTIKNEATHGSIRRIKALRTSPEDVDSYTFSFCNFTDREAPLVAFLLRKAQHLNACDLGFNQFTSKGLHSILSGLRSRSALVMLNLDDNKIDDEGGKELLNFIQTHPNLKKCDISSNPMSLEMHKSIEEAIKRNENRI